MREVIIGILSDLGYRTLVARTGPEALELLAGKGDRPFVYRRDHAGRHQRCRTGPHRAPAAAGAEILATSGYTPAEPDMAAARQEFPFLAKPYRLQLLGRKLKEFLPATLRCARRRDFDHVIFDHRVGEQLPAHRFDRCARAPRIGFGQLELDQLALPDFADAGKAQRRERVADCLALRVEHAFFKDNVDAGFHRDRRQPYRR